MGLLFNPQLAQRYYKLGTMVTWGLPTVAVPALRLTQDPPETRWKLFSRDFSTYSLGAGLFFLFESLAQKAMKGNAMTRAKRNFYAVCVGVLANVVFAGLGAPRVYNWIEKLRGNKAAVSRPQPRPLPRTGTPSGNLVRPGYAPIPYAKPSPAKPCASNPSPNKFLATPQPTTLPATRTSAAGFNGIPPLRPFAPTASNGVGNFVNYQS